MQTIGFWPVPSWAKLRMTRSEKHGRGRAHFALAWIPLGLCGESHSPLRVCGVRFMLPLGLLLDCSWIMQAVQQSFLPTAHGDAVQMASHPIDRLIPKSGPDPQMSDSVNVAWIPLGLLLDSVYGSALGMLRARWRARY